MTQTVYIFVPGILTVPGDAYNWCGRAVTWTHLHTTAKAEKIEYYSRAILRPFGEGKRAHKLQRTLRFYYGWDIHLIGHSNGCDVIVDALRSLYDDGGEFIRLKSLHLVSAACDRDFKTNGLNLWAEKIDRVVVYIAKKDGALRLAATTAGRWLGYGTLGKDGPISQDMTVETVWRTFGHSDWWAPNRFPSMMRMLTDPPVYQEPAGRPAL